MSIYPFTNENVQSYNKLYQFEGSKVLSIVGSGDQYFASILNGAKEVDLFDINPIAWEYFMLKFYAIQNLSYEEFWKYFVFNANELSTNKELISYLPQNELGYWKNKFFENGEVLSSSYEMWTYRTKTTAIMRHYKKSQFIPHMGEEEYYKLQDLLHKRKLPNFFLANFIGIENVCGNNSYDLVLASNILSWLIFVATKLEEEKVKLNEYFKTVENLKFEQMQIDYLWDVDKIQFPDFSQIYLEKEVESTLIPSVKGFGIKDCVLSLKKR